MLCIIYSSYRKPIQILQFNYAYFLLKKKKKNYAYLVVK